MRLFHSCYAHWPESRGPAGDTVIGSVEARSSEGHFTLFNVFMEHTSRTAHTLIGPLSVRLSCTHAHVHRYRPSSNRNTTTHGNTDTKACVDYTHLVKPQPKKTKHALILHLLSEFRNMYLQYQLIKFSRRSKATLHSTQRV